MDYASGTQLIHRVRRPLSLLTLLLLLAVPLFPMFSAKVHAATLTVTNLNDSGAGSLRQAVLDATAGDTIVFQAGLTGTILFESVIEIDKSLTVDGPGENLIELNGNDTVGLFYLSNEIATLNIKDLTFTHSAGFGAIRTEGGLGGELNVDNSIFRNNFSPAGGTIRSGSAVTTVTNSTFTQNSSIRGPGAIGASGTVMITNNLFQDNSASWFAGAISVQGNVLVEGNAFLNNTAATYDGGAILVGSIESPDVRIRNNTFTGNHAGGTGGAISGTFAIEISGNTFNGNYASAYGGAFSYYLGHCDYPGVYPLSLSNNTFTENSAPSGGAIYYWASGTNCQPSGPGLTVEHTFSLINNTLVGNTAQSGGAIYFDEAELQDWTIHSSNNIIANSADNNCAGSLRSELADEGSNLQFPGNSCGATIPVADPLLTPLANNGGPTFTMMPQAGSPILDAGNNAICAAAPVNNLDQRGITRPIGPSCDIGATEGIVGAANSLPVVADVTLNPSPAAINTTVTATGTFTDADQTNTHSAVWNWGDGITTSGAVTEANGSGTVSGSHSYTAVGVYTVTLTVTDNATGVGSAFQYVTVYNPFTGDVAGSGKYNSPAGALVSDPQATGQVKIGFSSKYINGGSVPIGNTKLTFKTANFDFDSSNYEWLVVDGAKGQFRGTGVVNGVSGYTFLLTAIDGDIAGGGGVDKFRIKIWNTATSTVVYDTQMGAPDNADPTMTLQQGHIMIHP